jgi:serine/threonine-protein kinase
MADFAGRYQMVTRIGSGGMGEVWLAHDQQLGGRPVAIKIMHAHLRPNERDLARFEREMRLSAMMDHPNIVTVYTTGSYDGAPFLVMEYLRGHDLETDYPGGAEPVASVGRDICGALAYAHGKGVIHRDIKPANLILGDSGRVKVTDFGIATAVSGTTLSTAGMLIGTFAYLPPERWRGDPPAFGNDIWAAGCVLYRCLSGTLPRALPSAADYAAAALRGDPIPDLRDLGHPDTPLIAMVMAMLDPDPGRRPTAAECARQLGGAPVPAPAAPARSPAAAAVLGAAVPGAAVPGATRVLTTVPRLPRRGRPGRLLAVLGGAAALVVAGSLVAWQFHHSPPAAGPAATGTTVSPAAPGTSVAARHPVASVTATPRGSTTARAVSSAPASASRPPAASPAASATASAPASPGPALVKVPNVVGLQFVTARALLERDGFVVVGRHTRLGQIVTGTDPSGRAAPGSVITVTYGTGL